MCNSFQELQELQQLQQFKIMFSNLPITDKKNVTSIGIASILFNVQTSIIASKSNMEPTAAIITAASAAVGIHLKPVR